MCRKQDGYPALVEYMWRGGFATEKKLRKNLTLGAKIWYTLYREGK